MKVNSVAVRQPKPDTEIPTPPKRYRPGRNARPVAGHSAGLGTALPQHPEGMQAQWRKPRRPGRDPDAAPAPDRPAELVTPGARFGGRGRASFEDRRTGRRFGLDRRPTTECRDASPPGAGWKSARLYDANGIRHCRHSAPADPLHHFFLAYDADPYRRSQAISGTCTCGHSPCGSLSTRRQVPARRRLTRVHPPEPQKTWPPMSRTRARLRPRRERDHNGPHQHQGERPWPSTCCSSTTAAHRPQ